MNLSELLEMGITASLAANGGLVLDAPKGTLTSELIERIRRSKPMLIAETRGACDVGELRELHGLCMNAPGKGDIPASDTATAIRATRWLLHFTDRDLLEVLFAPAADHAEVLADYPDAVAAEPLAEVRKTEVRKPVRTQHEVSSAVVAESPGIGCSTCRHRKRPGRAEPGYCGGGRDDLRDAYGRHHPLRKLPDDDGATCANYISNER